MTADDRPTPNAGPGWAFLTNHARVLVCIAQDPEIRGPLDGGVAAELYLSRASVKRHFERAYVRLGVSDRVAAVSEAMRRGLIA